MNLSRKTSDELMSKYHHCCGLMAELDMRSGDHELGLALSDLKASRPIKLARLFVIEQFANGVMDAMRAKPNHRWADPASALSGMGRGSVWAYLLGYAQGQTIERRYSQFQHAQGQTLDELGGDHAIFAELYDEWSDIVKWTVKARAESRERRDRDA